MKKKRLYLWASDYSTNTGEGNLARLFVRYLKRENKYSINFIKKKRSVYKYYSPFYGVYYCWKFFLKKQKVGYINYLPLWNFLIFLLLPPKTLIGPITGGSNYSNSNYLSIFIRGIIFPIFYKISEIIINIRFINIVFSTDLLKKYLSKKTNKIGKFNFVLNHLIKTKKRGKKIYDLLIYYRKHRNKLYSFPYKLIKELSKLDIKIVVVGDKLMINKIKNYGYINNNTIKNLQSKSRFTITSNENIYTLFTLECLSNDVKIITDIKNKDKIKFYKKNFIMVNFNNLNKIKKLFTKNKI